MDFLASKYFIILAKKCKIFSKTAYSDVRGERYYWSDKKATQ
jgi:hypothetical protein